MVLHASGEGSCDKNSHLSLQVRVTRRPTPAPAGIRGTLVPDFLVDVGNSKVSVIPGFFSWER